MDQKEYIRELFQYEKSLLELEAKLESLEKDEEIQNLQQERDVLIEKLESKQKNLDEKHKQMKFKEMESEQLHQEKQELESELYSGKTTGSKELKDMSDKITKLAEQEQEAFNKYCTLMEEVEYEQYQLSADDRKLTEIKQNLVNRQRKNNEEIAEIQDKISEKKVRISELRQQISEELLKWYEKLKNKYPRDAVVTMLPKEDTCGCGLNLSTEQQANLTAQEVIFCNSCGRILILTQ